jgi:hypothetical protein
MRTGFRDICLSGGLIMQITVRITNLYGNQTVYPVCEKALLLARLAGFKTLPAHTIETIKALGYSINVQPETI